MGFMHTSFLARAAYEIRTRDLFHALRSGFSSYGMGLAGYRMKRAVSHRSKCCQRNRRLDLDANVAEQGSACRYASLIVVADGRVALLAANAHGHLATPSLIELQNT